MSTSRLVQTVHSVCPPNPLRAVSAASFLIAMLLCLHVQSATAQVTTEAGLNDLVILDPGQHERGLPAVIVNYMNEHPEIEIPPKLHVHRYYYSGDKIFHAPILQGGPVVVVATHPKTNKRMYVDVVLPSGTPRIAHNKNAISYIYNDRRVEIKFQSFPFDPEVAVVKHISGKGMGIRIRDRQKRVREGVKESFTNSKAVNSFKDLAAGGRDLVVGASTSMGDLSGQGADTIKQLACMIPGVTYITSLAEQRPQKQYESTIENATRKNALSELPFVRTNR